MSKQVEEILAKILGQAKGGSAKVEGAARARLLKERSKKPDALWKMGTVPKRICQVSKTPHWDVCTSAAMPRSEDSKGQKNGVMGTRELA
ncbi:hypothetical protein JOM56_009697 [Amanita muscaria]